MLQGSEVMCNGTRGTVVITDGETHHKPPVYNDICDCVSTTPIHPIRASIIGLAAGGTLDPSATHSNVRCTTKQQG